MSELQSARTSDPHAAVLRRRDVAAQSGEHPSTIDRRIASGLLRVTWVPVRRSAAGEVEKTMPRFTQADVDAYLRSGVVEQSRKSPRFRTAKRNGGTK